MNPGELTTEDMEVLSWLADMGELSRPLAHSFNNLLNTLILNLAVIKSDVPESVRSDLDQIRHQATQMASLIKQFQQFGSRPKQALGPVDLNSVVRGVVDECCGRSAGTTNRPAIQLQLEDNLPPVASSLSELKRLVRLLLSSALSPLESDVMIRFKTERKKDQAILTVEDSGPSISAEHLSHLFELAPLESIGRSTLELAAADAIARRLGGSIRGENRREGGAMVIVRLPFLRDS